MNQDYILTVQRVLYFMFETVVGLSIIFSMVAVSLALGTWLINSFGDTGGYVWLGFTYVEFLCFDTIFSRITHKLRQNMPKEDTP